MSTLKPIPPILLTAMGGTVLACFAACSTEGDSNSVDLSTTANSGSQSSSGEGGSSDSNAEGSPTDEDTGPDTSADSTSDGPSSDSGPLLDVGGAEGSDTGDCGEGEDCGCDFVDILFVVDTSGSMAPHQAQLAAVFPLFVDVMADSLPTGTNLHVGITTQSGFWNGSGSGSWGVGCTTDATPYPEGYAPPTDGTIGGNGEQGRLYEHEGKRFFEMTTGTDDPAAMKAWFSTAATVPNAEMGQQAQIELLAPAGAYPFHPVNAATNAGFLRDEGAVLLIFYLTDTSDITPESAESLADIVRTAKSGCGGDDCILTAGMLSPTANCLPEYPRLEEFLNAFGKPPVSIGNIDGPDGGGWGSDPAPIEDYEAVLGDALATVVAQTCAEIPPVD